MKRIVSTLSLVAAVLALAGCSGGKGGKDGAEAQKITLYSAGDSMFTKEVIDAFREASGIEVEVKSDTETTRGVALRMAIEKEKDNPRADVFWNNEIVNTVVLKQKNLLTAYKSASAETIPKAYADPQGYWTAFGARARVFIVNTEKVKPEDEPKSVRDMLDPRWSGKIGIARPVGGTTATHAAALFVMWGDEEAAKFFEGLKANGVVPCNGNGHVKDQVANGELLWGLTDTNDVNVAILDGKPVKVVYPDQGEGQMGTLLIPHSVSLINGGPNPAGGKKFIDFLLRKETEEKLASGRSVQIPVREGVQWPEEVAKHFIMDVKKIKSFNGEIDWAKLADRYDEVVKKMNELFSS